MKVRITYEDNNELNNFLNTIRETYTIENKSKSYKCRGDNDLNNIYLEISNRFTYPVYADYYNDKIDCDLTEHEIISLIGLLEYHTLDEEEQKEEPYEPSKEDYKAIYSILEKIKSVL